jgi:hypothetical protein
MKKALLCLSTAWWLLNGGSASAQELAPRIYWPAPVGTNVIVLGYQRNSGDILIDPSLPITGVESEIDNLAVSYQRYFNLFGRTAAAQFNLPYADGYTEGMVDGEFRQRHTAGLTDPRLRIMINLHGAPAMDAAGFQALRADPKTIIGASLQVQAPTGAYDSDRLINLGTNRWAVKPALGMIVPLHPNWLFEMELGTWFFSDNDDFLGETREQKPIVAAEVHLIKRFRPGFWASLDANYYTGGETRVGSNFSDDLQRNSAQVSQSVFRSGMAMRCGRRSAPASASVREAISRCTRWPGCTPGDASAGHRDKAPFTIERIRTYHHGGGSTRRQV